MAKPHYLRGAAATWTPPVVVSFDTETTEIPDGDELVHILRCWVAKRRVRDSEIDRRSTIATAHGTEAFELADFVESSAELAPECWVYAHNLGFDLATTSLPFVLAARGWYVADVHLSDESCWWSLKQDGRKIILSDSWSWLRCSLEEASRDVRSRKVPLPGNEDALELWLKRCRRDVDILDKILAELMDWWKANDLGRWAITGAGCGWAAMRRQIAPRSLVVGPDDSRTPFEREALYGGRREVYRVGEISGSWSADFDLVAAYPSLALGHLLPTKAIRHDDQISSDYLSPRSGPYDVIARCRITTDRPVAPCRIDSEVWWPTGTFDTILSGPELRYVASTGAKVELGEGWVYKMDVTLADWAWWCLGLMANRDGDTPAIVRRVAKGWSRSVLGRFSARTTRVVAERPAEHLGWHLATGNDLASGAHLDVLSMNGVERTIARDVEPDDGFPAVTVFVEGLCRATLGKILDSRPQSRLIQCNTDGWWEDKVVPHYHTLPELPVDGVRITMKRLERRVKMLGPNHLKTTSEQKYSGVAKDATEQVAGTFVWHDWPGMRWQLEHSFPGEFRRPLRTVELADAYVRRWVLMNGETVPATAQIDAELGNVLSDWGHTLGRQETDRLATYQVSRLAAIRRTNGVRTRPRKADDERPPGRFAPDKSLAEVRRKRDITKGPLFVVNSNITTL